MPGIFYKAPTRFTGDAANALPVIAEALPVSGAVHRYLAANTRVSDGGAVESWTDSIGGSTLAVTNGSSPTMSTLSGVRGVQFNGVTDGLAADMVLSQPHTLVGVFNLTQTITDKNMTLFGSYKSSSTDMARVQVAGTAMYAGAGSNVALSGMNVTGWRVIVVTYNGASSRVQINDSVFTGDTGTLPRASLSVGYERNNTGHTPTSVAEVALYGKALSATEQAETIAHLRGKYGI